MGDLLGGDLPGPTLVDGDELEHSATGRRSSLTNRPGVLLGRDAAMPATIAAIDWIGIPAAEGRSLLRRGSSIRRALRGDPREPPVEQGAWRYPASCRRCAPPQPRPLGNHQIRQYPHPLGDLLGPDQSQGAAHRCFGIRVQHHTPVACIAHRGVRVPDHVSNHPLSEHPAEGALTRGIPAYFAFLVGSHRPTGPRCLGSSDSTTTHRD